MVNTIHRTTLLHICLVLHGNKTVQVQSHSTVAAGKEVEIIMNSSSTPRKRRDNNGDRAAVASSSSSNGTNKDHVYKTSSASTSSGIVRQLQFDDGKHIVISMASVNTCLKNMIIWGSLLSVGYQLGLTSCTMERQQLQQQQESSERQESIIRINESTSLTLKQIYDARNCESYLAQNDEDGQRIDSKSLPIYTEEQWASFRKLWRDQGGKNAEDYYKASDKRRSKAPPDFIPPVRVGHTQDGKGRGVFAARDIKKGEMTYGLSKNYIFFKSGHEFRRFLDALDDEKACDMMKFTWPQGGIGKKRD
jgi:hypothetical protein